MKIKYINIFGMAAAVWFLLAFVDSLLWSATTYSDLSGFGKLCTWMFMACFTVIFVGGFVAPMVRAFINWVRL